MGNQSQENQEKIHKKLTYHKMTPEKMKNAKTATQT